MEKEDGEVWWWRCHASKPFNGRKIQRGGKTPLCFSFLLLPSSQPRFFVIVVIVVVVFFLVFLVVIVVVSAVPSGAEGQGRTDSSIIGRRRKAGL